MKENTNIMGNEKDTKQNNNVIYIIIAVVLVLLIGFLLLRAGDNSNEELVEPITTTNSGVIESSEELKTKVKEETEAEIAVLKEEASINQYMTYFNKVEKDSNNRLAELVQIKQELSVLQRDYKVKAFKILADMYKEEKKVLDSIEAIKARDDLTLSDFEEFNNFIELTKFNNEVKFSKMKNMSEQVKLIKSSITKEYKNAYKIDETKGYEEFILIENKPTEEDIIFIFNEQRGGIEMKLEDGSKIIFMSEDSMKELSERIKIEFESRTEEDEIEEKKVLDGIDNQ